MGRQSAYKVPTVSKRIPNYALKQVEHFTQLLDKAGVIHAQAELLGEGDTPILINVVYSQTGVQVLESSSPTQSAIETMLSPSPATAQYVEPATAFLPVVIEVEEDDAVAVAEPIAAHWQPVVIEIEDSDDSSSDVAIEQQESISADLEPETDEEPNTASCPAAKQGSIGPAEDVALASVAVGVKTDQDLIELMQQMLAAWRSGEDGQGCTPWGAPQSITGICEQCPAAEGRLLLSLLCDLALAVERRLVIHYRDQSGQMLRVRPILLNQTPIDQWGTPMRVGTTVANAVTFRVLRTKARLKSGPQASAAGPPEQSLQKSLPILPFTPDIVQPTDLVEAADQGSEAAATAAVEDKEPVTAPYLALLRRVWQQESIERDNAEPQAVVAEDRLDQRVDESCPAGLNRSPAAGWGKLKSLVWLK